MKQGSADDPFAEEPADESATDPADERHASEDPENKRETQTEVGESTDTEDGTPRQPRSLPYIHARDGVKDGRTQRPVFLRDHVEDGIDDLVDQMEEEFGETVYKTDITEAAMVVAQENPDLLRATLEEWGYGWS